MAEQSKEKLFSLKEFDLKIQALEQESKHIEVKELNELCHRYHENMDTLSKMVHLPYILCSQGFMGFNYVLLSLEAMIASKVLNYEKASEEDKRRIIEEEKRIWQTKFRPKGKELAYDAATKGVEEFNSMLKEPDIYKSYRSLLYSAIVFIWCNFEMLMKDLWVTSLNMAGKRVKKTALDTIDKIDSTNNYSGIRGKYISIDYLGQYDYNIRNKLGSILVNKFDFSSPHGMKNAYQCAFPKSVAIKEAIKNEGLVQLEARRSVIVHRAGIIDADFCKKTGTNRKEIGNNLELSVEEVYYYGNITIDVALRVIKAVSSLLSRTTS